ncbi:hypothetical protein BKI52_26970 [marine bacterium AO1-C]|nr:hypothetical protein BKI52_26970 [marine bacterium AO1-C]
MNIFKKIKNAYQKHQETLQKHREALRSLSDEEILIIARDNNNCLTAQMLSRQTPLTYVQASIKIQELYNKGYLKISYKLLGSQVMVLKQEAIKQIEGLPSVKRFSKLSDAEVLKAAINTKGILTPASLCVALDCTIAQAQQKLEELQLQDVFRIDITEKGSLVYVLNDEELFRNTSLKKIG